MYKTFSYVKCQSPTQLLNSGTIFFTTHFKHFLFNVLSDLNSKPNNLADIFLKKIFVLN